MREVRPSRASPFSPPSFSCLSRAVPAGAFSSPCPPVLERRRELQSHCSCWLQQSFIVSLPVPPGAAEHAGNSFPSRCHHGIGRWTFSSTCPDFQLLFTLNQLGGLHSALIPFHGLCFPTQADAFFFLSCAELIFNQGILNADHVLFLNGLNLVSSKVTWWEKGERGAKACECVLVALGCGWVGGGTWQGWERSSPGLSLKSSSAKLSGRLQIYF